MQRQLQREAVDEYIATAEAEHGPVDPAEVAARAERIRAHHAAHHAAYCGDPAPADAARAERSFSTVKRSPGSPAAIVT